MVLNLMRKKLLAAAVMGAVGAAAGICTAGAFLHAVFFIRNRREIPVLHTKFFRFLMKYFRFLVKFGENNQFF